MCIICVKNKGVKAPTKEGADITSLEFIFPFTLKAPLIIVFPKFAILAPPFKFQLFR